MFRRDYKEIPSSTLGRKISQPRFLASIASLLVLCVIVGIFSSPAGEGVFFLDNDAADDQVNYLPGFGVPKERQYAGYIPVTRRQTQGGIWYWFIESRIENPDENTPIIMWLNGGPGASSMTGALSENGPYRLNQTDMSLSENMYSWNNLGHMLVVDQPVGTGYSYTTGEKGYVNNLRESAEDLYIAVTGVLRKHNKFANNPFVIAGESYAGKYIPAFAAHIHEQNLELDKKAQAHNQNEEKKEEDKEDTPIRINLQGLAIGNGELNPLLQYSSTPDYARAFGFIDQKQYDWTQERLKVCANHVDDKQYIKAYHVCQAVEDQIFAWAKLPFIYDVRLQTNAFADLTTSMETYLNQIDVKNSFNVGDAHQWFQSDGQGPSSVGQPVPTHLMSDELWAIPPETIAMLLENYKVLFYNGQYDGSSCNHLGTSRLLDTLQWKHSHEYASNERVIWTVDQVTAGYVRNAGRMHYVIVLNSGHLVPTDQPKVALAMMDNWLNEKSFS